MATNICQVIALKEIFSINETTNKCLSSILEREKVQNKLNTKDMELKGLISELQHKISIYNQEYWLRFTELYTSYYAWINKNFDEFVRLIPDEVVSLALNAYRVSKKIENVIHDIVFSSREEEKLLECIYTLSMYCNKCAVCEDLISFGFDEPKAVMSISGLRARIIAEKCVENMNKINNKYLNNVNINEFWVELAPHYIKLYTHLCDNFKTLFADPTCKENLEKWKVMAYSYENAYYLWSEDLIFTLSEKKLQKEVLIELKKYCMLMKRSNANNMKRVLITNELTKQ
jgi:hypothetical protein